MCKRAIVSCAKILVKSSQIYTETNRHTEVVEYSTKVGQFPPEGGILTVSIVLKHVHPEFFQHLVVNFTIATIVNI